MWNVIMYEKENGRVPVQEFLDGLPEKHRAKAYQDIDLLEEYGTDLTEPHVKHVEGKLWELRTKLASNILRIFYFIHVGNDIVLLHGFVKKSRKAPRNEIEREVRGILKITEGGTSNDLQRIQTIRS